MLDELEELSLQVSHLFRYKGCFKVFPVFQVHLCSLYLGLSLPCFVCLFL